MENDFYAAVFLFPESLIEAGSVGEIVAAVRDHERGVDLAILD